MTADKAAYLPPAQPHHNVREFTLANAAEIDRLRARVAELEAAGTAVCDAYDNHWDVHEYMGEPIAAWRALTAPSEEPS